MGLCSPHASPGTSIPGWALLETTAHQTAVKLLAHRSWPAMQLSMTGQGLKHTRVTTGGCVFGPRSGVQTTISTIKGAKRSPSLAESLTHPFLIPKPQESLHACKHTANLSPHEHLPPRNWMPPATLPTVLEMSSDTQQPMSAVRATKRSSPQPRPVTTVQILHSALGMAWKEA